jgi:hypothetical protein
MAVGEAVAFLLAHGSGSMVEDTLLPPMAGVRSPPWSLKLQTIHAATRRLLSHPLQFAERSAGTPFDNSTINYRLFIESICLF